MAVMLPNLAALRCCPVATGTILTHPVLVEMCGVCHEPLFGCANTEAGSNEDDWQNCEPSRWRMRPEGNVAVMRRCGGMVHVSCLQGWIDQKRAEEPGRTSYPCPKCSQLECISQELLEDLAGMTNPARHLEGWDHPLARRVRAMDQNSVSILRNGTVAARAYRGIRQILDEHMQFNGRYYDDRPDEGDPDTLLRGEFKTAYKAERMPYVRELIRVDSEAYQLLQDVFAPRPLPRPEEEYDVARERLIGEYFPAGQDPRGLNHWQAAEAVLALQNEWEARLLERLRVTQEAMLRILHILHNEAPDALDAMKDLHRGLRERQRDREIRDSGLYEYMNHTNPAMNCMYA